MRFACQPGCTNCCRQPGHVYLTDQDLQRAAEFLGMSAGEFERRYVYRTRHRLRLRKPRRASCTFLLADGCSIHPAKPTQCRAFPFWPELLQSARARHATESYCPGLGQGPLIQIEQARETAREMRTAYPFMYPEGGP